MSRIQKKIGGEDEAAFTQVIEEDKELNDIGQLHEEAVTTIWRLKILLEIHHEKEKATVAEVKDPVFSRQNDKKSMKISPESRKTPTEPLDVISGFWKMDPRIRSSAGSERPWKMDPRLPAV